MSLLRGAGLLAAGLLLAGCATRQAAPALPADPAVTRAEAARRAAIADWSIQGRVALSDGRQGGSGRIEWSQSGDAYRISLAAPVTRQGWRLHGDARWARLEGLEGGPREGADAEALLLSATRWRIPVQAMTAWVRGIAADSVVYGDARVVPGASGLPATIEQAGWQVDYRDWHDGEDGRPALPRRIEARQGEAKVRLIVDAWRTSPDPPDPASSGDSPRPQEG